MGKSQPGQLQGVSAATRTATQAVMISQDSVLDTPQLAAGRFHF